MSDNIIVESYGLGYARITQEILDSIIEEYSSDKLTSEVIKYMNKYKKACFGSYDYYILGGSNKGDIYFIQLWTLDLYFTYIDFLNSLFNNNIIIKCEAYRKGYFPYSSNYGYNDPTEYTRGVLYTCYNSIVTLNYSKEYDDYMRRTASHMIFVLLRGLSIFEFIKLDKMVDYPKEAKALFEKVMHDCCIRAGHNINNTLLTVEDIKKLGDIEYFKNYKSTESIYGQSQLWDSFLNKKKSLEDK